MMPQPIDSSGMGDTPIHCEYCKEEYTMSDIVSSPEGKPCCKHCMTSFIEEPSDKENEAYR